MSEFGSLYIIDTEYNSGRDAYEVTLGYMEKDEDVKGRFKSIRVIVNITNHKDDEKTVIDIALKKACDLLEMASKAPVELE
jgi:uncharacterized OsmC-like protein